VTKIEAVAPCCLNFAAGWAFHLVSQTVTSSRQISGSCHLLFDDSERKTVAAIVLRRFKRYESDPMSRHTTESYVE
jgi:hypothetical protein